MAWLLKAGPEQPVSSSHEGWPGKRWLRHLNQNLKAGIAGGGEARTPATGLLNLLPEPLLRQAPPGPHLGPPPIPQACAFRN